ncbi:MAG: MgtC/SapB family protein [Clostridia bacterium]|nr:MgtC/SapB family protein [Clostridia bacterium]
MLGFLDPLRDISFWLVVLKCFLALLFGCIIGFERSYKNRPAGFRTHILVTLGGALVSMLGIYIARRADVPSDISRMGAQVVAGLGFLGAGTIIVTKNYTVKGLTTAAGLWTSGIIGLAIGAGFYEGAVITTVLVLLAETMLGDLVNTIKRDPEFMIEILFSEKAALDQALRSSKNQRMIITNLKVYSAVYENAPCYRAYLSLRPRTKVDRDKLFGQLKAIDGIIDITEADISGKK